MDRYDSGINFERKIPTVLVHGWTDHRVGRSDGGCDCVRHRVFVSISDETVRSRHRCVLSADDSSPLYRADGFAGYKLEGHHQIEVEWNQGWLHGRGCFGDLISPGARRRQILARRQEEC